ncbi:SAICAR synthase-like protein [Eremomyces bilateralis CBS 781.70]|uniref:1-phosphatidylinositol-4-phosphate 5-kinase n=1 Tax=Eremomyces bilateralis CBS 781.70 TaxID=1392243 RepID=A0A6G1FY72_9PEZI|nr:SAICAR synthase-like protein [Eremomyces bilateralis CBS 781.70]KAF1810662.1 SAICAR synthase-like protein [Eremomyces bilateralis CBS 781.70]
MPSLAGLAQPVADAFHYRSKKHSHEERDAMENEKNDTTQTNGDLAKSNGLPNGRATSSKEIERPNGAASESTSSGINGIRRDSKDGPENTRLPSIEEAERQQPVTQPRAPLGSLRDDGSFAAIESAKFLGPQRFGTTSVQLEASPSIAPTDKSREHKSREPAPAPNPVDHSPQSARNSSIAHTERLSEDSALKYSSPYRMSTPPSYPNPPSSSSQSSQPFPGRLQHRHTLEVPRVTTASRPSRELPRGSTPDDVISAAGRFSPSTPTRPRRSSMTLVRRATRSIQSDIHDEGPQDEEAARWAEHVKQRRVSKRKRKDDEDEDRVVVGTKVDQTHVNWVTAYNMLTGIRFTVSRTNAKVNRDLTDADFDARHKFSFDITGNELTPSAKYDFKFKDYAPWVFRHLRSNFRLDPADYLVSLTSKYILSELGSPGKSGSFFYFSRDYKYIIKTIHHAEHKFLRKILRDYYRHVQDNPNTLLSQFYGLHRVKIPYGRKIHFVVMNNLFPPHRDIHQTFDLKGSTIGREYREEDLEKNPRATLKDINWLRRNRHLQLGPTKKQRFIQQMERDVKLLQRLKIMDYSLLIGIHDLSRGNEEQLREKNLSVFQPGGEADDPGSRSLMRTPSVVENARKARELRQMIKSQKPIPIGEAVYKMPEEMEENDRSMFYFYGDDGGFRATHEDNRPGEEIYYLGIIDCLTHYGFIKRFEHFLKGLTNTEPEISAIPPDRYGDRFVRFMSGISKSREVVDNERRASQTAEQSQPTSTPAASQPPQQSSPGILSPSVAHEHPKTERLLEKASRLVKSSLPSNPDVAPDRTLTTRPPDPRAADRGESGAYTLPVVEEAAEDRSVGGKSNGSGEPAGDKQKQDGDGKTKEGGKEKEMDRAPERPPPTPPKDDAVPAPITGGTRGAEEGNGTGMQASWADTGTTAWDGVDGSWSVEKFDRCLESADGNAGATVQANASGNGNGKAVEMPLRTKGSFDKDKALPALPAQER